MENRKKQEQLEERLRAMGEKEMEELRLPESLRPENIKEKILDYENKRLAEGVEDPEKESAAAESERMAEIPERAGKRPVRHSWKKGAGILMGVAAAALVLFVGTRNADLWSISGQQELGAAQTIEDQLVADMTVESATEEADQKVTVDAETLRSERENLDGVRRMDSYEELFDFYKENGVLERREEEKVTIWDKLGNFFYGGSKDVAVDDAMPETSMVTGSTSMNSGVKYDLALADGTVDAGTGVNDSYSMTEAETEDAVAEESIAESGAEDSLDYSDTNVQVEGVDESDIIKTDGKYVYRLSNSYDEIVIYQIDGPEVTWKSTIPLEGYEGDGYRSYNQMLLAGDRLAVLSSVTIYQDPVMLEKGETAVEEAIIEDEIVTTYSSDVVFTPAYPGGYAYRSSVTYTELTVYDVSDPSAPQKLDTRVQEGNYQDVRMVDGIIYLVSYKGNSRWFTCNEKDEMEYFTECYIPLIDGERIECDHIYVPEEVDNPSYVVITSTDIRNPGQFLDSVAIQGDATQMYASNNNIYLWQTEWNWNSAEANNQETITTIMKYSYQDGVLAAAGRAELQGYLNNSFSMDEYQGYLRVVTTREYEKITKVSEKESYGEWITENQLFVLNEQMQMVGRIQDIAPGEYIKSARFFGDIGYFVTFRQTDPLFSVDLSDPVNPRIIGQLKIPGFSEYLHPYGEGLLLGIGQEADIDTGGTEGVKLSMFDVSDPANVREVAKCMVKEEAEWSHSDAEYDHKAILASAGKNIIGFSMESNGYQSTAAGTEWNDYYEYYVFSYEEGQGFVEHLVYEYPDWESRHDARGIYIGDYLYIVCGNRQVIVYSLTDWSQCGSYDFR